MIIPVQSYAHPAGTICKSGSEMLGWMVDCSNHQSSASFTWNTPIPDSSVAVDYRYRWGVSAGASRWSGTVNITNTATSSPNGYIHTVSDPNTSKLAIFYDYTSNSQGHLYAWKIKLNKLQMDSLTVAEIAAVAAHELGHAIGLNDLKLSGNSDKLMYAYWPLTATSPTAKDIEGAKEATKN